jgi:hypothetical protein
MALPEKLSARVRFFLLSPSRRGAEPIDHENQEFTDATDDKNFTDQKMMFLILLIRFIRLIPCNLSILHLV